MKTEIIRELNMDCSSANVHAYISVDHGTFAVIFVFEMHKGEKNSTMRTKIDESSKKGHQHNYPCTTKC